MLSSKGRWQITTCGSVTLSANGGDQAVHSLMDAVALIDFVAVLIIVSLVMPTMLFRMFKTPLGCISKTFRFVINVASSITNMVLLRVQLAIMTNASIDLIFVSVPVSSVYCVYSVFVVIAKRLSASLTSRLKTINPRTVVSKVCEQLVIVACRTVLEEVRQVQHSVFLSLSFMMLLADGETCRFSRSYSVANTGNCTVRSVF
jgi:hypothetical protein